MKEANGSNSEWVGNEEELLVQQVLSLNRKIRNQDTDQKLKTKAQYPPNPLRLPTLLFSFFGKVGRRVIGYDEGGTF